MTQTARKPFRITGWHVLIAMILFFGTITAVNTVMITLAVKSFPGEQQKKSYMQGLHYNEVLAERAAQEELGWQAVMVDGETLPAMETAIRLQINDEEGRPVHGLSLTGTLGRPATDREDRQVVFEEAGNGVYAVTLDGLTQGTWALQATGMDAAGNTMTMEKRLWLEE